MNSTEEDLAFRLFVNFSIDQSPEFHNDLFRLPQTTTIYWHKILLFLLFISLDFLRMIMQQSTELIDLTNEDLYYSLSHQQFQSRYGPRSLINYRRSYHFYNDAIQ